MDRACYECPSEGTIDEPPEQGHICVTRMEGDVMQDAASEKKIRLGEVASALNIAPKLIRNWTASAEFDLLGSPDRAVNKWREYSYVDVAHLAIAAQAIRYGFSIGEAHDFAGATLVRILQPLMQREGSMTRAPGGIIEAICRGKSLYLFKLSDGESISMVSPMDAVPRYHGAVHIDLEMCVGMAFAGLKEIGHDAFSTSHPLELSEEEAAEFDRRYEQTLKDNPDLAAALEEAAKENAE